MRAYQRVQPLTIGELWAVPISLRIVLVENLRRLAVRIVGAQMARQGADRFVDELLPDAGAQPADLIERAIFGLGSVSPVAGVRRATGAAPALSGRGHTALLEWLHHEPAAQGASTDDIVQAQHQRRGGREPHGAQHHHQHARDRSLRLARASSRT